MIEFSEKSTCAVSGHRALPKNFNREILKKELKSLIWKGYKTFLVGMAIGFDTECFLCLDELKETENLQIIACVPCLNQDERFSKAQKETYRKLLKKADGVILIQEKYDEACMKKRNAFMVERSDALYSYCIKAGGGAYQTAIIAREKGKKIYKYGETVSEN